MICQLPNRQLSVAIVIPSTHVACCSISDVMLIQSPFAIHLVSVQHHEMLRDVLCGLSTLTFTTNRPLTQQHFGIKGSGSSFPALVPQTMLPQHMDVVVPAVLRSRLGQLLGEFERFLQHKGYTTRRQDKQPGGHLTAWWLYARIDNKAPAKSEVQYGETDFAEVNPAPHLWTRAKEGYRKEALRLLREFVAATEEMSTLPPPPHRPAPRPLKVCLATFDPTAYGVQYLALNVGDSVEEMNAPTLGEGWAYGRVVYADGGRSECGWFPPAFVR